VFHDCTLTLWMYVCVEITFHTFLISALAGSKDEVTPVTKRHTETSPNCTTVERYQLHASTTSTPQDIFLNPLQSILGRWTPEQISTQYWWKFSCPSQESNSFTYVYLQQTSLSLLALLSKTCPKLSVSPSHFKTIRKFWSFNFLSLKLHKNGLWFGQVKNSSIHNNDRRFFWTSKANRPVLGPTPPLIQCIAGVFQQGIICLGVKLPADLRLMPRLRIRGDEPPNCAKTELYFSLYRYILILLWFLALPVHDCMTATATCSGQ